MWLKMDRFERSGRMVSVIAGREMTENGQKLSLGKPSKGSNKSSSRCQEAGEDLCHINKRTLSMQHFLRLQNTHSKIKGPANYEYFLVFCILAATAKSEIVHHGRRSKRQIQLDPKLHGGYVPEKHDVN